MKLKPKCSVDRCQLAAMPHSRKGYCRYHMVNKGIPRKSARRHEREPVTEFLTILLILQRNVCCICGYRFYGNQDLVVDHLHPLKFGGSNKRSNLGAAHAKCNSAKSTLNLADKTIRDRIAAIGRHFTNGEAFTSRRLHLSEEDTNELVKLHESRKYRLREIAAMYHCSRPTIAKALADAGIDTSDGHDFATKQAEATANRFAEKAAPMYLEKRMSPREIGKAMGIHENVVRDRLKRAGVKMRSRAESQQIFTDAECRQIAEEYKVVKSTLKLAAKYGTTYTPINAAIRRGGGALLTPHRISITEDEEPEIVALCKQGLSDAEISKRYGLSRTPIARVRRKHGLLANYEAGHKVKETAWT